MAQGIYDKLEETYKLLRNLNKKLCCEPSQPTCNFLYQGTLTVGTDPEKADYIGYLFDSFGNISPFDILVVGIVYESVDSNLEVTISSGCYEYIDLYINGVKYTLSYVEDTEGVYRLLGIPNPPFVVGQTYTITICPGPNCDNLTTTTSTTTQSQEFFRASWLNSLIFVNRQGFVSSRSSWYSGNTVSSIQTSNPNLIQTNLRNSIEATGSQGMNFTRNLRASSLVPVQSVPANYNVIDGTNLPILVKLKDHYDFCNKIINNTFFSTRNASIFIKRVSSTHDGLPLDALFAIGIDFDATGNERDGYVYNDNLYDFISLPGTINVANFTYAAKTNQQIITLPDSPMILQSPSTSWVNNVTVLSSYGLTVRENFPIPPGW